MQYLLGFLCCYGLMQVACILTVLDHVLYVQSLYRQWQCIFNSKYKFTVGTAWILILVSAILILKAAPVECINRELDDTRKRTLVKK